MYIQPCCIDKELPRLMRGTAHSYFQSNGDWTAQDLMKAISCLVPECEATLCLPTVDAYLLRRLRTYLAKSWYRRVTLVTRDDQSELIATEVHNDAFAYAHQAQVTDCLFALTNGTEHLAITGPLLLEKDNLLHHYAGYYGRDAAVYKSAVEAVLARSKRGTPYNSPSMGRTQSSSNTKYVK